MAEIKDDILKLINLVDNNYKHKTLSKERLAEFLFVAYMLPFCMLGVLMYTLLPWIKTDTQSLVLVVLSVFTTSITIIVSTKTYKTIYHMPEEIVDWNYERMKNDCADLPLLYALISMKNRNHKLKLNDVAKINKELFNPENLMKTLYEEKKIKNIS